MALGLRRLKDRISHRIGAVLRRVERRTVSFDNERLRMSLRSCGRGVGFWGKVTITGAENICFGNNVHVGGNAYIRGEGGLIIGDNTHISRNLVLYTVNHRTDGNSVPYDDELVPKPVVIGKNVWIGMNVCIVPGATIGDGAIVGMGTVVSGDVPSMAIVASQKWRVVGMRNEEHYDLCVEEESYGGVSGVRYDASSAGG